MAREFGEARAGLGAGDVLRPLERQAVETAQVCDTDRVGEEGEHRRVVRRVAGERDFAVARREVPAEPLGEQQPRHAELVVVAEPPLTGSS